MGEESKAAKIKEFMGMLLNPKPKKKVRGKHRRKKKIRDIEKAQNEIKKMTEFLDIDVDNPFFVPPPSFKFDPEPAKKTKEITHAPAYQKFEPTGHKAKGKETEKPKLGNLKRMMTKFAPAMMFRNRNQVAEMVQMQNELEQQALDLKQKLKTQYLQGNERTKLEEQIKEKSIELERANKQVEELAKKSDVDVVNTYETEIGKLISVNGKALLALYAMQLEAAHLGSMGMPMPDWVTTIAGVKEAVSQMNVEAGNNLYDAVKNNPVNEQVRQLTVEELNAGKKPKGTKKIDEPVWTLEMAEKAIEQLERTMIRLGWNHYVYCIYAENEDDFYSSEFNEDFRNAMIVGMTQNIIAYANIVENELRKEKDMELISSIGGDEKRYADIDKHLGQTDANW